LQNKTVQNNLNYSELIRIRADPLEISRNMSKTILVKISCYKRRIIVIQKICAIAPGLESNQRHELHGEK
jgi:hypothetical protein